MTRLPLLPSAVLAIGLALSPRMAAHSTILVSVTSGGTSGNAASGQLDGLSNEHISQAGRTISADGRRVVFQSSASDLVPNDTNADWDVFVRDLALGTTARVSVGPAGQQASGRSFAPSISPNGRFVAFVSDAPDLVAGPTNGTSHVYVRDLETSRTWLASVDSSGNEGNQASGVLSWHTGGTGNDLSAEVSVSDGGSVAFLSAASNLVPNDTNGCVDVFVHDPVTGRTRRASVDSAGVEGNGWSGGHFQYPPGSRVCTGLSLSGDGRFVAFASQATNLAPNDSNGVDDVFVHDLLTGATVLASVDGQGIQGDGPSTFPSLSDDGRGLAFTSLATNLVPGDTNGEPDVFFRDLVSGAVVRVSVDSSGFEAHGASFEPAISARGRFVAFSSSARDLVPADPNGAQDVFVHDLRTGRTSLRSLAASGAFASSDCGSPSISEDARRTVFVSFAPDLVTQDTNQACDVFVRE